LSEASAASDDPQVRLDAGAFAADLGHQLEQGTADGLDVAA
jgi:hypothetical protein